MSLICVTYYECLLDDNTRHFHYNIIYVYHTHNHNILVDVWLWIRFGERRWYTLCRTFRISSTAISNIEHLKEIEEWGTTNAIIMLNVATLRTTIFEAIVCNVVGDDKHV